MPIFVFTGDSITDSNRLQDRDRGVGDGYVAMLANELEHGTDVQVVNRGISGDRVGDLKGRWQEDCLDLRPDLVSILVGVNDTCRRYDSNDPVSAESFEADYRSIIEPLAHVELVLVEPFLMPCTDEQKAFREDLDPKIEVVRRLADEFDAILVEADRALNAAAADCGVDVLTFDGVHLTEEGNRRLAAIWLETWKASSIVAATTR